MKTAFTLAEILITLGIIGVVAAMTIPNLITAHQKKTASAALKRAVSTINQAIRLSEEENGEVEIWDKTLEPKEFINRYFAPYIKISKICNNNQECGYNPTYAWKNLRGKYEHYYSPTYQNRRAFITMDGIIYTYSVISGSAVELNNDRIIIIDVNGNKKPNQHGKDVFFLYRQEEKNSVIPYGADKSYNEIKKSCSKTGDGLYCGALIQRSGGDIPSGYPWN